jgi:hypothetical protein
MGGGGVCEGVEYMVVPGILLAAGGGEGGRAGGSLNCYCGGRIACGAALVNCNSVVGDGGFGDGVFGNCGFEKGGYENCVTENCDFEDCV